MNGRFFLDTNIFVYSFDRSSATKSSRSNQLIERAVTARTGITSYQVVQEFFNVALRKFNKPMTSDEAEQYLSVVFRPLMTVNSSQALYTEALRITQRYRFSWFDSLILAAALEGGCNLLYSEDLQHGQKIGNLRVENPFL
ncbi:MAG TPA: PIN domain-containing protein [Candidatus Angelobacter sp.]